MTREHKLLMRVWNECLWGLDFADELREEIRAYLAAETEAEPVAWMRKWYFDGEIPRKEKNERGRMAWPNKFKFLPLSYHKCCEDDIPLYTRPEPAIRKPMTEEEIIEQAKVYGFDAIDTAVFAIGVRAAEKHHGIGGDE